MKNKEKNLLSTTGERIVVQDYRLTLSSEFISFLDGLLEHFQYKVAFIGNTIQLRSESDSSYDQDYTDFNQFLHDWIVTCEEAMEDPNIDHKSDIVFLKSHKIA